MNKILVMIFLFLMANAICAKELEQFYLKSSAANLNAIVSSFPETKDEHSSNLKLIFLSYALKAHPTYGNTLIANFEKFSPSQKNIVLHALYIHEGKEIFKKLNIAERNFPNICSCSIVDNIHFSYPKSFEHAREQTKKLDHLWAAFFATGKKKYVNVMLDYMKKENNESVKACAAEYINRQILEKLLSSVGAEDEETKKIFQPTDLVKKLNEEDPDQSKYLVARFIFYTTMWASLQANKQVPPMKMQIESK